jgi:hypothetical protein
MIKPLAYPTMPKESGARCVSKSVDLRDVADRGTRFYRCLRGIFVDVRTTGQQDVGIIGGKWVCTIGSTRGRFHSQWNGIDDAFSIDGGIDVQSR